jgi:hypothetical protein
MCAADQHSKRVGAEMSRDDDYRFGDDEQYFRALSAVIAERISDKEHAVLAEHFRSPNHTATVQRIAETLGYRNYGP